MRAREILTEAAKVGREYQHLEDLVFAEGSAGALRAASILQRLGQDSNDVAIKWDGNPTIYWGRDADGTFVLTGKNGWGKNKSTSSDDLKSYIMNTGKGEDWRQDFAKGMVQFLIQWSATHQVTCVDLYMVTCYILQASRMLIKTVFTNLNQTTYCTQ